jgi:general secretion pathway protein B
MSYILDALKKSDQLRLRGAAPTLLSAPATSVEPKKSNVVTYSVLAIVLIAAGIAIGWLRPWQSEVPTPAARTIAARSSEVSEQQNATLAAPLPQPETISQQQPKQEQQTQVPVQMQTQIAKPLPIKPPVTSSNTPSSAPSKATPKPSLQAIPNKKAPKEEEPANTVTAADTAQMQGVIKMEQLPLSIQQELPQMTISLHAYSSKPANRLVSINNQLLHEGDSPAPGVTLEAITPDGMILSYKEYRFLRGVQ